MTEPGTAQPSIVGRLLEEISWERATSYREGGRGRENVLSAEVLLALNFLPREHFLGAVLRSAHGAQEARTLLVAEIEDASMDFLPGDLALSRGIAASSKRHIQPDALLTSPGVFMLVEAKRIRTSAFQLHQLAREYVAVMANADDRIPVIFLLGVKPPFSVRGNGKMSIEAAVASQLESVLAETNNDQLNLQDLLSRVHEVFCWISWPEIDSIISQQTASFTSGDASVHRSIRRLAGSINAAIVWHS